MQYSLHGLQKKPKAFTIWTFTESWPTPGLKQKRTSSTSGSTPSVQQVGATSEEGCPWTTFSCVTSVSIVLRANVLNSFQSLVLFPHSSTKIYLLSRPGSLLKRKKKILQAKSHHIKGWNYLTWETRSWPICGILAEEWLGGYFILFLAVARSGSKGTLSSQTRAWTWATVVKAPNPNHSLDHQGTPM